MSNKHKVIGIAVGIVALIGLQAYGFVSMRHTLEDRIGQLEQEIQSVRQTTSANMDELVSDLGVVSEKIGVTEKDLQEARQAAEALRQEQARTASRLREELSTKSQAVEQAVGNLRQEATTRLEEVQNAAETRIGVVSDEVHTVKMDLDATKNDLNATRGQMMDMRDALGREIARNSTELAELRRRGERDYVEFDVRKTSSMQRIADISLQLKKADTKNRKYDIVLLVDDAKLEKKGHPINEPIQFLAGKDRVRYELVVFSVDKDRIRGYLSTPKGSLIAEGPTIR